MASEDERQSLMANPHAGGRYAFSKVPDTERYVRNTAFAFFKPTDYPTHDLLLHLLLVAPFPEHDRKKSIKWQACSLRGMNSGSFPGIPPCPSLAGSPISI